MAFSGCLCIAWTSAKAIALFLVDIEHRCRCTVCSRRFRILTLIQVFEGPERYGAFSFFERKAPNLLTRWADPLLTLALALHRKDMRYSIIVARLPV
jgi:hypothetical protein